MGLSAEILADLEEAFEDDLSDAVEPFTLSKIDRSKTVYDTETGTVTESSETFTIRGIASGYDQQERFNTHIEPTDIAFIVLSSELTSLTILPQVKEEFTRVADGKVYRIKKIEIDPLKVSYIYHLEGSES